MDKKDPRDYASSSLIDGSSQEISSEEKESIKDVMLEKIFEELLSDEKLSNKTEMTSKQVGLHAVARVFESEFKTGIVGLLVDWIERNSLSLNRASRKEYVKLVQNIDLEDEDDLERIKRGLLGG